MPILSGLAWALGAVAAIVALLAGLETAPARLPGVTPGTNFERFRSKAESSNTA